ncbi:MAG: FAD-dependent oxidoreductase [Acetobacteraceae bacterium]
MAEEESAPVGPDLRVGIDEAELGEDGMLRGHVDGEAVLLARAGGEVFAVGAECTHYHGPLAEGLKAGEIIHCPWHHARFSLRDGRAVRAPALDPLPCWRVERKGGRIVVGGKRAPEMPKVSPAGAAPRRIVIVGGGAAGNAAAETLRNVGYGGSITILSADTARPCDRPNLSKDYLAGTAQADWIPLRGEEFYRERKVDLRLGARVESIDANGKSVALGSGETLGYDALLLATGAVARRLAVPGAELGHVRTLRSVADCEAIIARAKEGRQAIVVGASFIGLEVAASLRNRGVAVGVVAPEAQPMERVLGPELGGFLRELHEAKGVRFHLGTTPSAISADAVTLANGERLAAGLVVVGVGVRPETGLAERAGIKVENGVLVDEFLETSAPSVFAAGDIARWPDRLSGERMRVEHWVVAERQGRIAARNMLGRRERCDIVPFFWTQQYDVAISYVGFASRWDRAEVAGKAADRDCTVSYFSGGRKRAVATIFRDRESLEAEVALERALAAG